MDLEPSGGEAIEGIAGDQDIASDAPTEENPVEEPTEEPPEEEGEDEGESKMEPLHKHERFRQVIKQNRQLRKENEALKKSKATTSPITDDFDAMFEGGPEHTFKAPKEYESIDEIYSDIRKAFFSDMAFYRDKDSQERSAAAEAFQSQLDSIQDDLGDDSAYQSFLGFLETAMKKFPTVDVDSAFDIWLENYSPRSQEPEGEKPKKRSKINKSNKKTSAKRKGPSMEYLRNNDFDTIVQDLMD